MTPSQNIAVIGGGVAGITASYLLGKKHEVTLFEKNDYIGGHTNTITVSDRSSGALGVDTGFIVCNEKNYPTFYRLLDEWKVERRNSDMSFGFFCEGSGLGYTGPGLREFSRQFSNFFKPVFLKMLREQRHFNKNALSDLKDGALEEVPLGEYLGRLGCSEFFIEHYLLPIGGAIWSSPDQDMLRFPAGSFVSFFNNHGMLELSKRPMWQTIVGGSHTYIRAFRELFRGRVRSNSNVSAVTRNQKGVTVVIQEEEPLQFDHVVLAAHADESLALLGDASEQERELLGAWSYHPNDAVLHTDVAVMPENRRLWASWNYYRGSDSSGGEPVSITYHMNRLQGLRTSTDYFVTLNRTENIDPQKVLYSTRYMHPAYTPGSIDAQRKLRELNGNRSTSFCGSYMGYGFHEDAVRSAAAVAATMGVPL